MFTQATLAERDLRFKRLRAAMEQQGLDALVIAGKGHWWTGRGYFRYLTDFHLWGHDGLILMPLQDEPMLTLTSAAVAARIGRQGWITDTHGDPEIAVKIVDAIQHKGLDKARIGIAGQRFIISAGTYNILTGSLPDATFVNADNLMDRVRMVKSQIEIQQNRELWALAKAAMERFVEVLEAGKSQLEVVSEATKVVTAGGGRDTLVFFGGNPPADVPVELEDILGYHMEICAPSGHWCELTVTCAFREPTELEQKLMDTELRFYEEIRAAAKPGVKLSELEAIIKRVYVEDGWELDEELPTHYDMHGQGMDCMEWPFYGPLKREDVVLEEGMVFSYHPRRAVLPTVRRTGINENIVITADGIERLAAPWDLRWRVMV